MPRKKRFFFIGLAVFTVLMIVLTIDMARQTTAPWKKKKSLDRILPVTPDSTKK